VLAAVIAPHAVAAQGCNSAGGCRQWSVEFRPRSAHANAGALDTARNVAIVAGRGGQVAGALLAGFDATTGRRLWASSGSTTSGSWYSVAAAAGTTVVTGGDSMPESATTAAYDTATGRRRWFIRQPPSGAVQDAGVVALVSSRRSLAISVGMVGIPTPGRAEQRYTWRIVAYDLRTGRARWRWTRHGPFRQDTVTDAALTPDGGTLVVTGYSLGAVNEDSYVVAFDTGTGRVRWTDRRDDGNDEARAVAMSPDGRTAYVAGVNQRVHGSIATAETVAGTVVALDVVTGHARWSWRAQPSLVDVYPNAAAAYGGSVCVAGTAVLQHTSGTTAYVACLDARGQTRWQDLTTPTPVSGDIATSIAPGRDGSFYVGGSALGPAGNVADAVTTALDAATGTSPWRATVSGGASYDRTETVGLLPCATGVLAVAHVVDDTRLTPAGDPNTSRAWVLSRYRR
jgi:hypothetical protein